MLLRHSPEKGAVADVSFRYSGIEPLRFFLLPVLSCIHIPNDFRRGRALRFQNIRLPKCVVHLLWYTPRAHFFRKAKNLLLAGKCERKDVSVPPVFPIGVFCTSARLINSRVGPSSKEIKYDSEPLLGLIYFHYLSRPRKRT